MNDAVYDRIIDSIDVKKRLLTSKNNRSNSTYTVGCWQT